MALRIFRSNPALGGFGGGPSSSAASESDPIADGDAFAQILKELVDNAVDACSVADSMSPALKSSSVEKRVRVTIESISNKDDDDTSVDSMELLRITVIDNGVGMKNIQQCVNPFHSTKQQQALRVTSNNDSDDASQSSETQESQEEGQTVGRYGIGLTLCFLHGQRLVANTSSQITSATAASSHWTNTLWVVDPDDDTVKCVKQWHIDKVGEDVVSGTKVSLVLPVSPHSFMFKDCNYFTLVASNNVRLL
jgi:DNA topoisomerase VI subunit B